MSTLRAQHVECLSYKVRIWSVGKHLTFSLVHTLHIENAMEEGTYDHFWIFHKQTQDIYKKTLKISESNSFFPKNDKNLLFN